MLLSLVDDPSFADSVQYIGANNGS